MSIWWCPECPWTFSGEGDGVIAHAVGSPGCTGTPVDLIDERERLLEFVGVVEKQLECPCPWCGDCIETICEALEEARGAATPS